MEPSSALSYGDLIIEVATKLGVAFYGDNGDEEAQVPRDVHDLSECKKHVNNAIRMFLSDAPAGGWRCQHPIASVVLWPSVAVETVATVAWVTGTAYILGDKVTNAGESYICIVAHTAAALFATDLTAGNWRETHDCTGVYRPPTNDTLVTAANASFYPSMELKIIVITGEDSYTIASYVSATAVTIAGDHHWTGAKTFSIAADGNFTLPQTFGGQYTGDIIYAAGTLVAGSILWTGETRIRQLRANTTSETGEPNLAAVRPLADERRRWELIVWPIPVTVRTVEFIYELHFSSLVNLTDVHPCGFAHDEAIKAACMAVAERDAEDQMAGLMQYYRQVALPNSFRIDGRQAPRRLGNMGRRARINKYNFRDFQRRPEVTMTP